MPYAFEPSVKGRITEQLLSSLLDSAGYRVVPIGIEHSIQQLKTLAFSNNEAERRAYQRVDQGLRKLPDFLVLDLEDADWGPTFVEVKFRKSDASLRTDVALHRDLLIQATTWREVYVVFFLGRAYGRDLPGHQPNAATNRCRVFKIRAVNGELRFLAMVAVPDLRNADDQIDPSEVRWWHGIALERFFLRLNGQTVDQTIRKATMIASAVGRTFAD